MQDYYCALGTALFLEGVMSALYHVCPNGNNLQFDLVFIFVALILVLMKNLTLGGFLKSSSEVEVLRSELDGILDLRIVYYDARSLSICESAVQQYRIA